jgi:hypothetical protein
MLARTSGQADIAVGEQHVPVRRRNVDMAAPDRLLFSRVRGGKFSRLSQQIGQNAAALPDMGDDKQRPRVIGR